jgi:hypothetical protein
MKFDGANTPVDNLPQAYLFMPCRETQGVSEDSRVENPEHHDERVHCCRGAIVGYGH